MPRETILPLHDSLPELQIQWGAHEVQFGIETPSDPQTGLRHHLVDHLYGQGDTPQHIGALLLQNGPDGHEFHRILDRAESPEAGPDDLAVLGRWVLDAVTGASVGHTGLWTTLARPGLNRVVKVTRRARDVAHGADE